MIQPHYPHHRFPLCPKLGCGSTGNLGNASDKFFLCTSFGDSDEFFSSLDLLRTFQGSIQGNKGAPALWLVVSVFLVLMLHRLGHIARICAAMSLSLFVITGFIFVDDTDLITVTNNPSETPEQVTA